MTEKPAAPPELLQIVSCACQKGCESNRCSCRKAGIKCSMFCKNCEGTSCSNCEDEPQVAVLHDEPENPSEKECEDFQELFLNDVDADVCDLDDECNFDDSNNVSNTDKEHDNMDLDDNIFSEIEQSDDENDEVKDLSYPQIINTKVRNARDNIINVHLGDD